MDPFIYPQVTVRLYLSTSKSCYFRDRLPNRYGLRDRIACTFVYLTESVFNLG
jgi:hypothetical protein